MSKLRFTVTLEPAGESSALFRVPPEVAAQMGGRARIPVRGKVNGYPFRGSTMPMGDGTHCVGLNRTIRDGAGVGAGDTVTVEISRDDEPRTVSIPPDLRSALADAGLTKAWDALSFTHQREHVSAVEEAKKPATRARRIGRAVAMLQERSAP